MGLGMSVSVGSTAVFVVKIGISLAEHDTPIPATRNARKIDLFIGISPFYSETLRYLTPILILMPLLISGFAVYNLRSILPHLAGKQSPLALNGGAFPR
jgi:hypothetical protein